MAKKRTLINIFNDSFKTAGTIPTGITPVTITAVESLVKEIKRVYSERPRNLDVEMVSEPCPMVKMTVHFTETGGIFSSNVDIRLKDVFRVLGIYPSEVFKSFNYPEIDAFLRSEYGVTNMIIRFGSAVKAKNIENIFKTTIQWEKI